MRTGTLRIGYSPLRTFAQFERDVPYLSLSSGPTSRRCWHVSSNSATASDSGWFITNWISAWRHKFRGHHTKLRKFRGHHTKLGEPSRRFERGGDCRAFVAEGLEAEAVALFLRHEHTGRPLGETGFPERIETTLSRVIRPRKRGTKPRTPEEGLRN